MVNLGFAMHGPALMGQPPPSRFLKESLTHRMPCSGDIKAKRPIPLTTPQILPPLFLFLFLFLFLLLFLPLFLISQSSGIEVRGTIGGALSRMQGRGAGAERMNGLSAFARNPPGCPEDTSFRAFGRLKRVFEIQSVV
jgi:hypothetical protein